MSAAATAAASGFIDPILHSTDPLKELERFSRKPNGYDAKPEEALQQAKALFGEAQFFLANSGTPLSAPLKARLINLLETLQELLETILNTFGIADFFKPASSQMENEFKFHKIMAILSFITLIASTLLPLLGVQAGLPIVCGTFLAISVLSIIYPKFAPMPTHLPEGENWSKKARNYHLPTAGGREGVVRQIAQTLILGRTHPILVGPTGIGKTETVKAFVNALEVGDYPELNGKRVFYFNTASVAASKEMFGGGSRILQRIEEQMGRHADDIILVFDEIHAACGEKNPMSEQLKTRLDGVFKHVIGLTTQEEYDQHIATNSAFARRFTQIAVESMPEDDTTVALAQNLLQTAPEVVLDPSGLDAILEQTRDQAQPLVALQLLAESVNRTAASQISENARNAEVKRGKIRAIHARGAITREANSTAALEGELAQLEDLVAEEKQREGALIERRHQLFLAKVQQHTLAIKVQALQANRLSSRDRARLTQFALLKDRLIPALDAELRESHLCSHITRELVGDISHHERRA